MDVSIDHKVINKYYCYLTTDCTAKDTVNFCGRVLERDAVVETINDPTNT